MTVLDDGPTTLTHTCPTPTGTLPTTRYPTVIVEPSGRLRISTGGVDHVLHPAWLRDRSMQTGEVDPANRQRLYEPGDVVADLAVLDAGIEADADIWVRFSDGELRHFDLDQLVVAVSGVGDADALPRPQPWTADDLEMPTIRWSDVVADDTATLLATLDAFHRFGCFVIAAAPAAPGALRHIASSFGRITATNFGELFDVRSVVDPEDLAYTPVGLAAHTDQPYRTPTPGLQFLHTISNSACGGESTVVDGLAAVNALRDEHPQLFSALCAVPVEWRYDVGHDVVVATAPVIELTADGDLRQFRFSPRLDFPHAVDPDQLDAWYLGRRVLADWLDDPAHRVEFKMCDGDVLVIDNHRVLHGRREFDVATGHRHLQGCYIDHDGPATMLRLLRRRHG